MWTEASAEKQSSAARFLRVTGHGLYLGSDRTKSLSPVQTRKKKISAQKLSSQIGNVAHPIRTEKTVRADKPLLTVVAEYLLFDAI